MKKYSKFIIPLLIIFSLFYLFPRLYNIQNKLEFSYDQGFHLMDVFDMVKTHKIRLIGPEVTSKLFMGREFFIGPHYYYILTILGIISHWSPLTITILFVLLQWLFYLILVKYVFKFFGFLASLVVSCVVALSPYFVSNGRFFWNPHFIIPLSILFIIYFDNLFLASILWGMAFSFHYTALFWALPILISLIYKKRFNLKNIFIIFCGFILGDLPFFIFELRHNFYNIKTILLVFTHTRGAVTEYSPHYFIYPLFILIVWGLLLLSKKYKKPFYLLILLFLFFKSDPGLDQIKGWTYPEQLKVRDLILQNGCPQNYNIATTIQGDTRFHSLRFLLIQKKCPPNKEDDYSTNKLLYLVAPSNRPPETETVWEITSAKPFKIIEKHTINQDINLFLLNSKI